MPTAWHLAARPQGMPKPSDFALKSIELPALGEGMIRVRNHWLSVDPYMRGRMTTRKSYVPPFAIGEALQGGAVGEVIASNAEGLKPGDLVQSMFGWREAFTPAAVYLSKLPALDLLSHQ